MLYFMLLDFLSVPFLVAKHTAILRYRIAYLTLLSSSLSVPGSIKVCGVWL